MEKINITIGIIIVMIIILTLTVVFMLLIYRIFVLRIIRERAQQHKLEIQYQKDLLEQSIRVQEEERERIAIKLHDVVGNKLNILSIWLNNPNTWNSSRSKEIVEKQVPELIEATRNISHSLYPVNLERFGLIIAIEELISNVEESLLIHLILIHDYQSKSISFEVQIYRVIQEFLTNVIKHANSMTMLIYIRDSNQSLALILSDDGQGFDFQFIKKGLGIRNIELRLNSIGARYKWKVAKNKGCQLTISIPNS